MSEREVARFFDEEAHRWNKNYEAGGSMLDRTSRFVAALAGEVPAGGAVLDYGCGTGNIADALARAGYSVTGVDISGAMIEAARARLSTTGNFHHITKSGPLPFPAATFDACVASSVLEYVDDPRAILRELVRVLRPSGRLVVTVPDARHPLRRREARIASIVGVPLVSALARVTRWRGGATYIRLSKNRYSPEQWCALLEECGFAPGPILAVDTPLLLISALRRGDR
jgi:ubiquinone/menaquinone biosynthesis C-methylase UbiE